MGPTPAKVGRIYGRDTQTTCPDPWSIASAIGITVMDLGSVVVWPRRLQHQWLIPGPSKDGALSPGAWDQSTRRRR